MHDVRKVDQVHQVHKRTRGNKVHTVHPNTCTLVHSAPPVQPATLSALAARQPLKTRRYCPGDVPTRRRNARANEVLSRKPDAKATSLTGMPVSISSREA